MFSRIAHLHSEDIKSILFHKNFFLIFFPYICVLAICPTNKKHLTMHTEKKWELAIYLASVVTLVFFLIWVFSNIEGQTLFTYYIVAYSLSVLSVLFAPNRLFKAKK